MKKLSELVENTVDSAKQQIATQDTLAGGLKVEDGKTTMPCRAPLEVSQAIQIRSLVRRAKQNFTFKMGRDGMEKIPLPDLTAEEQALADYYRHPASKKVILRYLQKLAIRKRMDTNDETRAAYIIADDTDRLYGLEVTEMDMSTMVDHFIENDESAFYPQYAQMKKRIKD